MKKRILSFLVIGTFALYIAYQKIGSISAASTALTAQNTNLINAPIDQLATLTPSTTQASSAPASPKAAKKSGPSPTKPSPSPSPASTGQYVDGTYTGASADAYYGNVQVAAVVRGGRLADVQILDYPQDRNRSVAINTRALPALREEAIQAQSADVNFVSGATDSSGAFIQSLSSALSQAQK
jgi:uncharacterized protein with FMN-binding domain